MRKFIRHPADIPLEYALKGRNGLRRERLRNVSFGGLCFHCVSCLEPGTRIQIRVSVGEPPLDVDGVVAWSAAGGGGYDVGVAFDEPAAEFSVRVVERVRRVERRRLDTKRIEGPSLRGDPAAEEWIEKAASGPPSLGKTG